MNNKRSRKKVSAIAILCMMLMNFGIGHAQPLSRQIFSSAPPISSGVQKQFASILPGENLSELQGSNTTKSTVNSVVYSPTVTEGIAIEIPSPTPLLVNDDYGNTILTPYVLSEKTITPGKIENDSDIDMFVFSSVFDSDIIVKTSRVGGLTASVLDYGGNAINAETIIDNLGKNEPKTILRFHALKNMKYYVKLVAQYPQNLEYSISYEYLIDDYSDNANDAKVISKGESINGNLINDNDIDVFKLEVPETGIYTLDYSQYHCWVSIADGNGIQQPILDNVVLLNSDKTYYAKIERNPAYGNTFTYNFKIDGPVQDDYGNSMDTATKIDSGKTVNGSIDYSTDIDYFSFIPSDNCSINIYDFSAKTSTGNAMNISINKGLKICDSYGNSVGYSLYNKCISFDALKGESYYVAVLNGLTQFELYNYTFKLKTPNADDFGNNSINSTEISLGKYIDGEINNGGDADCFSFKPSMDGTYLINFNSDVVGTGHSMPVENPMRIYDGIHNYIVNNSNDNYSKSYCSLKKDIIYYIVITATSSNPLYTYSFNVEGPVVDDFGNNIGLAHEIKLDKKVDGKENFPGDIDYFCFEAIEDGLFYIHDYAQDNTQASQYKIYENKDTVLDLYSDKESNTYFYTKKGTTYYVSVVKSSFNKSDNYSFIIKGPVIDDFGDTKEFAGELKLNDAVTVSNYPEDSDYMRTMVLEDGLYYFDLQSSNNNINDFCKSLQILDSNDQEVKFYNVDSKIYFNLLKNSIYNIKLSIRTSSCKIPSTYSFAFKGPVNDDYGDSKETAHKIELNNKMEGNIGLQDSCDYFKFFAEKYGVYKLDLSSSANNFYNNELFKSIELFDADGNIVYKTCVDNSAIFTLDRDCEYFLAINKKFSYPELLRYSFIINGPVIDDYGNNKDAACSIQLNDQVKGEINYINDWDYFEFIPSKTGAYYFEDFTFVERGENVTYPNKDFVLKIVDSDSYNVHFEIVDNTKVLFNLNKDTRYYFGLSKNRPDGTFDYAFVLKGLVYDDFGDNLSHAETLEYGKTINGKIDFVGDKDCFSFTTESKGVYSIPEIKNVDWILVDSNYNYINAFTLNYDNSKHFNLPANKTYYIVISNSSKLAEYSFTLDGPIQEDYSNNIEDAKIMKADTPVKGTINYYGDVDILQVIPQKTGNIYFRFDAPDYMAMKIYNSDRVLLKQTNVKDNIVSVEIKDLDKLYLQVDSYEVLLTGDYTVTLSDSLDILINGTGTNPNPDNSGPVPEYPIISPTIPEYGDDYGNSLLSAQPINEKTIVSGKIEIPSDTDIFTFSSNSDVDTIVNICPFISVSASVLDCEGNVINCEITEDFAPEGRIQILKFRASKNMKYYVKIKSSHERPSEYGVSYEQLEDDFGNNINAAVDISLGNSVAGNLIDDSDIDVFRFAAPVNGIYKLDSPNSMCSLRVFDKDDKELPLAGKYVRLNKDYSYYLKVQRNVEVKNTFLYRFMVVGPINDDFGDSEETAAEIGLNKTISGSMEYSFDSDCFRFTPSESGLYQVYNFTTSTNSQPFADQTRMIVPKVYDSAGNLIDYIYCCDRDGYINLNKGVTYYISISITPEYFQLYKYSFMLRELTADDIGNSMENAKEIKSGILNEGEINNYQDIDYFRYTPALDGEYCISLSYDYDGNNYSKPSISQVLKVYDKNGNYLGDTNYDYLSTKAYLYFNKDVTYYISVLSTAECSLFKYNLKMEGPVDDDYGNSEIFAKEVQIGTKIYGKGDFYNDPDYFSFKPSEDGIYGIIDYMNADYMNFWRVYDAEGNELFSNMFISKHFSLEKNKVYYVKFIKNIMDPCPDYSFIIEGPVEDHYGNSKESAMDVKINDTVLFITDYYQDAEFVKISPSVDGLYCLDLSGSKDGVGEFSQYVSIVDSSDNRKDFYSVDSKVYVQLNKNTTYYISISGRDYPSSYTFVIDGPKIDEYGDSEDLSYNIELNQKVEGISDSQSDIDCFCFKAPKDGMYKLDFNTLEVHRNRVTLSKILSIFDVNERKIDIGFSGSSAYFNLSKDSVYYLKLANSNVLPTFYYSFTINAPDLDDYADKANTCGEINLGEQISGKINHLNDYDYFKFKAPNSGIYYLDNVSFVDTSSGKPYSEIFRILSIVDGSGNIVDISMDYPLSKIHFNFNKDTTYYICFRSTSGSTNILASYSFELKGPILDDFGNSPTFSGTIGLGKTVAGKLNYIGDVDYFGFTTGNKGLYFVSSLDKVDIRLVDSNNEEVKTYPVNLNSMGSCYCLEADEVYYIRIDNSNNAAVDYSINLQGPIPEDYPNVNEYTDIIKINTPIEGAINYSGDIDMFKFMPQNTGDIYIKFDSPDYFSMKVFHDREEIECTYINDNIIGVNLKDVSICDLKIESLDKYITGEYTLTVSDKLENLLPGTYKITGYVKPEICNKESSPLKAGFVVSIKGTQLSAVTNGSGYFEINDVPKSSDGYDVEITKYGYLKREITGIKVEDNISISDQISPIDIWAGDLSDPQDGAINMEDILEIAKSFGHVKGKSGYVESRDVDGNSAINIQDIIILAKHFNKISKDYPIICSY